MDHSGTKVLVTGAAGFIGSHLADALAERCDLLLLDDFSIGSWENLEEVRGREGVRIVEADITDFERMRELVAGVDVVFHMAISCLRTSIAKPLLSHDINAGGTLSVLMAAYEHEVERFLYVSSSEVYGSAITVPMTEEHPVNPTTVYGASKLAGEVYALAYHRTYGMPVSVVRPFNTYGPREPWSGARAEVIPRFALQLLAGRPPVIYGDGSQTRDFTFVSDTVRGLVAAAECDALVGEVVNVAFGQEASIRDIAGRLAALTGRDLPAVHADARPGDVDRHYADVAKARRLFGVEPEVALDDGLARTLEWFRSNEVLRKAGADAAGAPNW